MTFQDVLNFWFQELNSSQWWGKNSDLDHLIEERFGELLKSAAKGELYKWRATPQGRLAEIIVLDQFSRNIHRNRPEAFENDKLALVLAQEMVLLGLDKQIPIQQRAFVYMPYMHSESRMIHEEALKLFSTSGMEFNLEYELDHKKIIDQFGRYPHRNSILNRLSTLKELEFMKQHQGY